MTDVRVLVVEGAEPARRRVARALGARPGMVVVGETADGAQGIALCESLRPDAIALGAPTGPVDALRLTEFVMANRPTPILLVPAEGVDPREILAAGAVDVLAPGKKDDPAWEDRLVAALRLVARIRVITHPRYRLAASRPAPSRSEATPRGSVEPRLVAVGASTGGPAAVATLLRSLAPSFPLPILLVVHVGEGFGGPLERWLDGLSPLRVALAVDGEPLPTPGRGRVVLAPPDRHLAVEGGVLRLSSGPPRHSCRPSVDVLFESLAREVGAATVACLLTGMGRDGAAGLLALRNAGAVTYAQDRDSSAVFGMPREAIALGAARRVLPLTAIGRAVGALGRPGREP